MNYNPKNNFVQLFNDDFCQCQIEDSRSGVILNVIDISIDEIQDLISKHPTFRLINMVFDLDEK